MVENEEFCDIFVHYQYADYDQYEPSMHRKRSMLHKTLDTAEPSDVYNGIVSSGAARHLRWVEHAIRGANFSRPPPFQFSPQISATSFCKCDKNFFLLRKMQKKTYKCRRRAPNFSRAP